MKAKAPGRPSRGINAKTSRCRIESVRMCGSKHQPRIDHLVKPMALETFGTIAGYLAHRHACRRRHKANRHSDKNGLIWVIRLPLGLI